MKIGDKVKVTSVMSSDVKSGLKIGDIGVVVYEDSDYGNDDYSIFRVKFENPLTAYQENKNLKKDGSYSMFRSQLEVIPKTTFDSNPIKEMYDSFIESGFTENQAMEILKTLINKTI